MRQDSLNNKRVVCAMSGGVDSSVAALLLKREGLEVIGITMKLWECFKSPKRQTCCSVADVSDARNVCEQLGIPHHVVDMREVFRKEVIEYFVQEYSKGRTPNPCIRCNEVLKFNLLREESLKLFNTDIIATGHYARIDNGLLLKGKDHKKDQSYFLFTLTKNQLTKTLFPVGGLTKSEVRKLASEIGLKTAKKKESQEICFVTDNDYAGFIGDYYPALAWPSGNFVDSTGKILGRHEGIQSYTIGQRRGLGFGIGKRQYVIKIDAKRNEVVLGSDDDLYKNKLTVTDVNWLITPSKIEAVVKIRYRHDGADAVVTPLDDNKARIEFVTPQRAITPGQAAVFYKDDKVTGGGWILE